MLLLAIAGAPVLAGCSGTAQRPAGAPLPEACTGPAVLGGEARAPSRSSVEWRRARAQLEGLRRALQGSGPHTLRLAVKLREPFTGRVMEARGAVALSPPSALRMILLGPGGTTALDLWVREDRFRFAVPAIDVLRRGDAKTPRAEMRGLPVDFLKWWLLRPAEGTLLWHRRVERANRFILRDGPATVDLCALDDGAVIARRTTWSAGQGAGEGTATVPSDGAILDEETVVATGRGCGPVRYTQASTGLEVGVVCEGEETSRAPNPRAFIDPDEPEQEEGDEGGEP